MQQLCNGFGSENPSLLKQKNVETRSLPGLISQPYLQRQSLRESNARSYPRRLPIAIREAQGIFLTDMDGNVYFDCLAGAGTLALGHNNPVVIAAMQTVLTEGYPLHTLDLTTPIKDRFVEELYSDLRDRGAQNKLEKQ
jgi:diaminobutyrate-2-oxoglutarate transaminase